MNKIDTLVYQSLLATEAVAADSLSRLAGEADQANQSLVALLVKQGLLTEHEFLDIISEKLQIPRFDLRHAQVEAAVIEKVPSKVAHYYNFFPVRIVDQTLTVAVSYPLDIKVQDEIRTQMGLAVEMVLCSSNDIADALKKHYGFAVDTLGKMAHGLGGGRDEQGSLEGAPSEKVEDIERLAEDASVVQLVNQLILEAFRKRATDIHIEPYRTRVSMRYRVDGILYDSQVPVDIRNYINPIISRIKIMSNLNIVERRLPQDGRAVVKVGDAVLDLRISTIPTPFGESVVIRILPTQMLFSLQRLGLEPVALKSFEEMLSKPHGIIFVTGPTGSGKTTTLYACLSRLNTRDRKIITIEDPIEYEMAGITQIQVMPEIGLDFSRGLRSILRHDPDVIMVGEVRDLETAEIAIRVALTGHLVFSTLHTNDAASGITRLVDVGVEPYLVASSVEAFIAQRLIRLICPACKYEDTGAPVELREMIAREAGLRSGDSVRIFRGRGCAQCNETGFLGRTAIYEILTVDADIKELIVKKAPSDQIKRLAIQRGMRTLRQDGWHKVLSGSTTPEEVMKVAQAEEELSAPAAAGAHVSLPVLPSVAAAGPAEPPAGNVLNKRVYRRLKERVNVRYTQFTSPEEVAKRGYNYEEFSVTRNISAGGILFIADQLLAVGAVLDLNLELPDNEEPVNCLARVVRVDELEQEKRYDIAVVFLDLTGAQRSRLDKHVEQKAG